ncbi:hypothetical protein C0J52_28084 [Blattella germanica]|nr:hypothetical protein C0J52_28084 [Blattella germanica]
MTSEVNIPVPTTFFLALSFLVILTDNQEYTFEIQVKYNNNDDGFFNLYFTLNIGIYENH